MWTYILLGILQGIFEWIPISSEGIIALTSNLLLKEVSSIDVALFLHLGTFLSALIYFRTECYEILTLKNKKLLRFLIITTAVSLALGYPIYKLIKNIAVGSILLIITGMGLFFTAYFQKKKINIRLNKDKLAVIAGLLQGLAVIPGLSRSGATIFGLSLGKQNPYEILKISYLMSLPVVFVMCVYLFLENPKLVSDGWFGLVSSFVIGFLSLHLLLSFVRKISFFWFALGFGILCFMSGILEFL